MARKLSPDKLLFTTTLALVLVGVVMVFSASAVMAEEKFDSPYYFLIRQGRVGALGLIGMWWAMHVDYRSYRHPLCVYGGLFVCILLLVGVFFMDPNHNTHRWIRLGSLSFQPSELSKPALVIFMASLLEKEAKRVNDWRHTLLPCLAVLFVVLGLIVAGAGPGDLHHHRGGGICAAVLRRTAAHLCAGRRPSSHTAPVLPGLFL